MEGEPLKATRWSSVLIVLACVMLCTWSCNTSDSTDADAIGLPDSAVSLLEGDDTREGEFELVGFPGNFETFAQELKERGSNANWIESEGSNQSLGPWLSFRNPLTDECLLVVDVTLYKTNPNQTDIFTLSFDRVDPNWRARAVEYGTHVFIGASACA